VRIYTVVEANSPNTLRNRTTTTVGDGYAVRRITRRTCGTATTSLKTNKLPASRSFSSNIVDECEEEAGASGAQSSRSTGDREVNRTLNITWETRRTRNKVAVYTQNHSRSRQRQNRAREIYTRRTKNSAIRDNGNVKTVRQIRTRKIDPDTNLSRTPDCTVREGIRQSRCWRRPIQCGTSRGTRGRDAEG